MNPRLIAVVVTLILLSSPQVGLAQREPGKNDNARFGDPTSRFGDPTSSARVYQDYLFGVIKKVAKSEVVLEKTKFGVDQTIRLDPKTKFIRDGKPSSPEDLKIGEDVYVQTKKDKKTGDLIARKVVTGFPGQQTH